MMLCNKSTGTAQVRNTISSLNKPCIEKNTCFVFVILTSAGSIHKSILYGIQCLFEVYVKYVHLPNYASNCLGLITIIAFIYA